LIRKDHEKAATSYYPAVILVMTNSHANTKNSKANVIISQILEQKCQNLLFKMMKFNTNKIDSTE